MSYRVIFTPEAEEQLVALYNYIAKAASLDIAERYTEEIVSYCESLHTFPHRGTISQSEAKLEPADLVVVFPGEKQRIEAGITPQELMAREGMYAEMYGKQAAWMT